MVAAASDAARRDGEGKGWYVSVSGATSGKDGPGVGGPCVHIGSGDGKVISGSEKCTHSPLTILVTRAILLFDEHMKL